MGLMAPKIDSAEALKKIATEYTNPWYKKWEAWFMDFHRRREVKGVKMRILFDFNNRTFGEKRKQFKLTQVRYLPRNIRSTSWIDLFNDTLLFVIIQEPIAIVIRDPSLSQSMRQYFDVLWKISSD